MNQKGRSIEEGVESVDGPHGVDCPDGDLLSRPLKTHTFSISSMSISIGNSAVCVFNSLGSMK